jgi:hypothetical protein
MHAEAVKAIHNLKICGRVLQQLQAVARGDESMKRAAQLLLVVSRTAAL